VKLVINIEYSATADRPGEGEQEEEQTLDTAREFFADALVAIRRRCEAAGLELSVEEK
jgi:hypothetical protein